MALGAPAARRVRRAGSRHPHDVGRARRVAALDLSEVVLAGPDELLAPLVPVVERTLAARLLPSPTTPISVRLADSPHDIVLRGAAALVLWDRLGVV
ncbi:MAG: hypothetical protein ACRCZP_13975 [Phycicoccus sp.]